MLQQIKNWIVNFSGQAADWFGPCEYSGAWDQLEPSISFEHGTTTTTTTTEEHTSTIDKDFYHSSSSSNIPDYTINQNARWLYTPSILGSTPRERGEVDDDNNNNLISKNQTRRRQTAAKVDGTQQDDGNINSKPTTPSPDTLPRLSSYDHTWSPRITKSIRKRRSTDFSSLRPHRGDWEVTEFSGGGTTAMTPRPKRISECANRLPVDPVTYEALEELYLQAYTAAQRRLYHSVALPQGEAAETLLTATAVMKLLNGYTASEKRRFVTTMFKKFVVELTRGAFFTHLTSSYEYTTLFCRLEDTLETLILDQNNGRRIEFPLKGDKLRIVN